MQEKRCPDYLSFCTIYRSEVINPKIGIKRTVPHRLKFRLTCLTRKKSPALWV